MSQKSRMLLTILINLGLVVLFASTLYVLEKSWQERQEVKKEQQLRQAHFLKIESYLAGITSIIDSISNLYTGRCDRNLVLYMRRELFNLPGAIELGVIEKDADHGVVVCNSWGENERIIVREPVPHKGFLITGPHTINSLEMPIYVIKKTTDEFEYNILIKKSSVDEFLNNSSSIVMSIGNRKKGDKYRDSQVIENLSYLVPLAAHVKSSNLYFIPTSLLFFIVCFFLVTPRWARVIEKAVLRRKIRNHYYYNEYQPIVNTQNHQVFSIEVFLRSKDGVNVKDSINKIKSLDLCIEHTMLQIRQIKQSFSADFLKQNSFQLNISSIHLQSAFFVEKMLSLEGLICTSVILEVVEDEDLMAHKETIKHHMQALKHKGYRFAIDDFGIQYSGLSYISEFDFDIVKTDKIFIEDKGKNTAILKAIITLTNELGIECIAEGIETLDDKGKINALGIYLHQGWLYSRPMSAQEIAVYQVSPDNPGY